MTSSSIIPVTDLLLAYSNGCFPMSDHREDETFQWYSAQVRGIIPLDAFHLSKNVRRMIRQGKYRVSFNTSFEEVISSCADRSSTWISNLIIHSYIHLHTLGYAHSVEVWENAEMVGGLYGVALQGAFFGESMFKRRAEADKIALYYCHQRLVDLGFKLWDTQFYTDHLAQFGCIEISDKKYDQKLKQALTVFATFD